MAKVKKRAVVTGVRNVKASKNSGQQIATKASSQKSRTDVSGGRTTTTRGTSAPRAAARPKVEKARKSRAMKTATKRNASMPKLKSMPTARAKARTVAATAPSRVVVKPLEPQAKCGAGTSVQYLFRVDESIDGRTTTHLVFFDRHGWYCEHGRNCPAVGHAKKYQGHIARAS